MPDVDLGKQVGPLPLGAWVAVVGAGLGIAFYTRRQSAGAPVEVEDTSGTPGVGEGGSGLWTDITTPTTGAPTATTYTDNDAWGKAAIDRLVAEGYNPTLVYSAITKALAGGTGDNKMGVAEYAVWSRALVLMKAPPYPVNVPGPVPINPLPTTTPPVRQPADYLGPGAHRIGRLGASYTLRSVAMRATLAKYRANPTVVETVLRRLVAANPSLRNRTAIPGGTLIVVLPGSGTTS